MNQNSWLAFNTCREKNLESYNLQKQTFLANTSVLPAVAKEFAR